MNEEVTSPVVSSSVDTSQPGETYFFETTETIITTPDVLERIATNTKQSADCLTSIVGVGAVCFVFFLMSVVYKFFKNIT